MSNIKLCKCGCGEAISEHNQNGPIYWKKGHNMRGKSGDRHPCWGRKLSENERRLISIRNRGEAASNWAGDSVGYKGLHKWVHGYKPKPQYCETCGISKPFDVACVNGIYKRDFRNWKWLCRHCHMILDYKNGIRKPRT